MYSKKIFLLLSIFFIFLVNSFALEIPINGAIERQQNIKNTKDIAYVDMQQVFEAHPMAEKYRLELKDFAKSRKNTLDTMNEEYKKLETELADIVIKLNRAQTEKNNGSISELSNKFDEIKKQLDEKKNAILDLTQRTKTEMSQMEEQNSLKVLNDIEAVIEEISSKYDIEVILDKQSVLCGSTYCRDLTNEVISNLKGRQ